MTRIPAFLLGVVVGAALLFVGLRYHVVRADDGFHFVPKSTARLNEPYVDIRKFTITDWEQHQSLAMALVQAKKGHLMQGAATETVRRSFNDLLGGLTAPTHR